MRTPSQPIYVHMSASTVFCTNYHVYLMEMDIQLWAPIFYILSSVL